MKAKHAGSWLVAGAVAALLLAWALPRAYPLLPAPWKIHRAEAERKALALLADLAPVGADSHVVVRLVTDRVLERRLTSQGLDHTAGRLAAGVAAWEVTVYPPKAPSQGWSHRGLIAPGGEVLELRRNPAVVSEGGLPSLGSPQATAKALLKGLGLDAQQFSIPVARTRELPAGFDLALRYTARPAAPGADPSGVDVLFTDGAVAGMTSWHENPQAAQIQQMLQPAALLYTFQLIAVFLFLPLAAIVFLRRYHAGEMGLRGGVEILLLGLVAGIGALVLSADGTAEAYSFQIFTRGQMTWVWAVQLVVFHFFPVAIVTFLGWTTGASFLQERWPQKMAAVSALRRGAWETSTLAVSSLRGLVAGLSLAALLTLALAALRPAGVQNSLANLFDWSLNGPWPGLAHLLFGLSAVLYMEPLLLLFVFLPLSQRLGAGRRGLILAGLLTSVVGGLSCYAGALPLPVGWSLLFAAALTAAVITLFVRYDLLTALLASLVAVIAPGCVALLGTQDAWLQLQGGLPLAVAALPLALSLRWLLSGQEYLYDPDPVPAHVRRIAERERQSLELETARSIQSSILPQLPPVLAGVEIAHAYLPATEVGGDFYDVLVLEDGRLAAAVGDVAGHGVSSGLIMSMVKSALAVQVTYDPRVEEVFKTLNRMVYQSARRRLLATLSYLVLDPKERRVLYASAGHVAPYRIRGGGRVEPLEATAYPLGARSKLEVSAHQAFLEPGDSLFLYSDGVVEARAPGSDDLFGFERLETSLAAHGGSSATRLRDGVLSDLLAFTGPGSRADDQTILVLRVP